MGRQKELKLAMVVGCILTSSNAWAADITGNSSSGSSASPKGVFGGYAANAAAQNNTVSITGTVASGGYAFANCSIYGGYAGQLPAMRQITR